MNDEVVIAQQGQNAFFENKFNKVILTNERIKNNNHHSQLVIDGLGSTAYVPIANKVLEFGGCFLILFEILPEKTNSSNNFLPVLLITTSMIACLSIMLIIIKRMMI